jgi:hypothetical protein
MATPPGPASPGNPISFDNLRSEAYITPNVDISLYLMGTYIYDDGFIDDHTFYPNYYPLPASPSGGPLTLNMAISMFYDIDSYAGTDCNWSSGSPSWVSNPTVSVLNSTFLGSGSNTGPNPATSPLTIATFTSFGTIGSNMEHWYSFDCSVNFAGPPPPPFPPPANVNVQYKFGVGGTWTNFPGSPGTQTSYSANGLIGLGNGQTFYVQIF